MAENTADNFEEKQLLTLVKKGNLDAFERILFRYEKPIYGYIFRLVNQHHDAQDLTQEVFIKVFTHRHTIDINKNFKAWLYTIATNRTYDWLRKKRSHPELFIIDDPENSFETIDIDRSYQDIERVGDFQELNKALDRIKPVYKTVITLYYQQDFDYKEIATILSIPINTVKTYLYRAKAELRAQLSNDQYAA